MANSWIDHVKSWAKTNNMKYGDALKSAECKKAYKPAQDGTGIKRKKQSWLRWGVDRVLAPPPLTVNPDKQFSLSNVVFGYNDFTNKVFEFLKKHQNEKVVFMEMWRTPVPSLLTGFLNAVSFGAFNKELETKPYDTIFHLACHIKTNKGTRFILEKNEVISITKNPKKEKTTETIMVTTAEQPNTLYKMIEKTKNAMGEKKFFGYSARDNNCQDFQIEFLKANDLLTGELQAWIKQDSKSLFGEGSFLRKLSNTVTETGARATALMGTGKKPPKLMMKAGQAPSHATTTLASYQVYITSSLAEHYGLDDVLNRLGVLDTEIRKKWVEKDYRDYEFFHQFLTGN